MGLKPTINCIRGQHANYYDINVVWYIGGLLIKQFLCPDITIEINNSKCIYYLNFSLH